MLLSLSLLRLWSGGLVEQRLPSKMPVLKRMPAASWSSVHRCSGGTEHPALVVVAAGWSLDDYYHSCLLLASQKPCPLGLYTNDSLRPCKHLTPGSSYTCILFAKIS